MPDVYEIVSTRIIEQLERGVVPWKRPWHITGGSTGGSASAPVNAVSKKPYRGVNLFLLPQMEDNRWLSYKQAQQLGGSVRKGEKGYMVVFWKMLEEVDDKGRVKKVPLLRYYTVFNVSQCDGLKLASIEKEEVAVSELTIVEEAEAVVSSYLLREGLDLRFGGDQAYYHPVYDVVQMPDKVKFVDATRYYSTMFHELGHSTGHDNRLARFKETGGMHGFGSKEYGKEELVAEFSAAFMCAIIGISNEDSEAQSASYLKGWAQVIKEDKRLIVSAASKAQRAVEYIRSCQSSEEGSGEDDEES